MTTSPPPLKQQTEDFTSQMNGLLLSGVTDEVHMEAFKQISIELC